MKKPLLISACLLGIPCRYDGKVKTGVFGKNALTLDAFLPYLEEKYTLVPYCPEIYGGLPTPRIPSERLGDKVIGRDGRDVTDEYLRGATNGVALCHTLGIEVALTKAKSPACGKGRIYDGTHSGTLTIGNGVLVDALIDAGIAVCNEEEADTLL